ncbi:MAG: tetratricopeptide repeat protein, partial [Bacteroidota bacterium]
MLKLIHFIVFFFATQLLVLSQDLWQQDFEEIKSDVLKAQPDWNEVAERLVNVYYDGIRSYENELLISKVVPFFQLYQDSLKENQMLYEELNYCSGLVYTNVGQYVKAFPYCEQALKITNEIQPIDTIKRLKRGLILGHLYYSTYQYKKSKQLLEQSLLLASRVKDPTYYFRFLMNMGNTLQEMGEWTYSINHLKQAMELIKNKPNNEGDLRAVYINMAAAWISAGRPDEALKALKQANRLSEGLVKDQPGEVYNLLTTSTIYQDLAKIYYDLAAYDSALYYGERSLKEIKKIYPKDSPYEADILLNLGRIYAQKTKLEHSDSLIKKGININNKTRGQHNVLNANGYRDLAKNQIIHKNYDEADRFYQLAYITLNPPQDSISSVNESYKSSISPKDNVKLIHDHAQLFERRYQQTGNLDWLEKALEKYLLGIENIRYFKGELNDVQARLFFAGIHKEIYADAMRVLFTLYQKEKKDAYIELALNWIEQNKAYELFISLNEALLQKEIADDLFDKESNLKSQIAFVKNGDSLSSEMKQYL